MKNLDSVSSEEQVFAFYDPRVIDTSIPEQRALKENYNTRYQFIVRAVENHRVLDFCSMTGYGSVMLRRDGNAQEVIGLTANEDALKVAETDFACDGVSYNLVDENELDKGQISQQVSGLFDTIVFVDEFEHYSHPFKLLGGLADHLKPGGHIYFAAYVTPTMDVNPFHKLNVRRGQMRRKTKQLGLLIRNELLLNQYYSPGKALYYARNKKTRQHTGKRNLAGYYLRHPLQALGRLWSLVRYGFRIQTLLIHAEKPGERA